MTGIRRNIDRLMAQTDSAIAKMLESERLWLESAHPLFRDVYLKEQEKLTTKLNNMIWYGNEEGKKDE